ncbi:hypothetical protein MRX96_036987 [Rhipicephalus microplus]|uniref:Uncharacterized protein n=1 Tax=Rhipicephalus microplus TaxID=6941 RepID=A0A6G5AGN4_RHIMP
MHTHVVLNFYWHFGACTRIQTLPSRKDYSQVTARVGKKAKEPLGQSETQLMLQSPEKLCIESGHISTLECHKCVSCACFGAHTQTLPTWPDSCRLRKGKKLGWCKIGHMRATRNATRDCKEVSELRKLL